MRRKYVDVLWIYKLINSEIDLMETGIGQLVQKSIGMKGKGTLTLGENVLIIIPIF